MRSSKRVALGLALGASFALSSCRREPAPAAAPSTPAAARTPAAESSPPPERRAAPPTAPVPVEEATFESFAVPATPFTDFPRGVMRVAGPVLPPRKLHWPLPAYPGGELAAIEGRVVLESILGRSGRIERVRVREALHPEFDRVAREALLSWRFAPATLAGRPVDVYYNLTVNFRRRSSLPPA